MRSRYREKGTPLRSVLEIMGCTGVVTAGGCSIQKAEVAHHKHRRWLALWRTRVRRNLGHAQKNSATATAQFSRTRNRTHLTIRHAISWCSTDRLSCDPLSLPNQHSQPHALPPKQVRLRGQQVLVDVSVLHAPVQRQRPVPPHPSTDAPS